MPISLIGTDDLSPNLTEVDTGKKELGMKALRLLQIEVLQPLSIHQMVADRGLSGVEKKQENDGYEEHKEEAIQSDNNGGSDSQNGATWPGELGITVRS